MADAQPASTQFLKLVGIKIKVPVRSAPNAGGAILKYLIPNDIVKVKVMNSKNFYRTSDGLVRLLLCLFFNLTISLSLSLSLLMLLFDRDLLTNIRTRRVGSS